MGSRLPGGHQGTQHPAGAWAGPPSHKYISFPSDAPLRSSLGPSCTPQPPPLWDTIETQALQDVSSRTQQLHDERLVVGGSGGCDGGAVRGRGAGGRVFPHTRNPHTLVPRLYFQAHPVLRLSGPLYFVRPGRWWCVLLLCGVEAVYCCRSTVTQ